MNINNVYKCSIYQLSDKYYSYDNWLQDGWCYVQYTSMFVKEVLVYKDEYNNFIDLETKEKYKVGYDYCSIGDFFINVKKGMIPLSSIIDYKRKNMTKRKILKKYKKVENGGRKE